MIRGGMVAVAAIAAAVLCVAPASAQHAHDGADLRAQTGFGLADGDLGLRRLDPDEVLQNFRAIRAIEKRHQEACATYGCIVLVNLTDRPISRLYLRKSGADANAWGQDWLHVWSSGALGPQHGIVLLGNSAAAYCSASVRFTLDSANAPEDVEGVVNLCTRPGEVRKLSISASKP